MLVSSHTFNVCREVLKTSGFALGFQHFFKPPDGYSLLVFKFTLFFVRELVLFEKWYQELVTLLMSAGKC